MPQDQILQIGMSILAVAAIVVFAHWLGFSRRAQLESEGEAMEILQLAPGGFEPEKVALSADKSAAIAIDSHGRIAIVRSHGSSFIAYALRPSAVLELRNGDIYCDDREQGITVTVLRFDNNIPDWVAPALSSKTES